MRTMIDATTIDLIAHLSDRFATAKITTSDVTSAMMDAAYEYATAYAGGFAFMTDIHHKVVAENIRLSAAQAAAILNCALGEYRYDLRQQGKQPVQVATPTATTQVVLDGFYTIVGPKGGHRTLKIETIEDGKVRQWVSYLHGADNEGDYKSVGILDGANFSLFRKYTGQFADIVAATRFLVRNVDKLDEYGRQYAIRSGKCYVCNRRLTTPESVAAGIGPVCSENRGL